jgi:hypothetical protein
MTSLRRIGEVAEATGLTVRVSSARMVSPDLFAWMGEAVAARRSGG